MPGLMWCGVVSKDVYGWLTAGAGIWCTLWSCPAFTQAETKYRLNENPKLNVKLNRNPVISMKP